MADEPESGELAAEDKAYFESRGEKLPEKPPEKVEKTDDKEAKAETETEAETDLDVLDEEAPKEDKKVPLRALTKEREEGKKARQALQELEKRHAVLEDRWNTILQLNQQPEADKPKKLTVADLGPEPDKSVDIFKWADWTAKKQAIQDETIEGLQKNFTEKEQTEKQAKEEAQRETAVWNFWGEAAKAEAAETPDFGDAVKWMSEARTKQLAAMKAFQPQFQSQAGIDQQINNELKQIVIAAAQQNKSPAKVVYEMAKEWGYTGPKEEAKPDTAGLEKLTKDMEAETSLSGAGGGRPGGGTDAKAIAAMSSDEFEAWYSKHGAAGFKRLQTRGTA